MDLFEINDIDIKTPAPPTYPTPGTTGLSNGTGNCNKSNKLASDGVITEEERLSFRSGNGGQLSPDWTEWLMGWPVGWTSLEPMSPEAFSLYRESVLSGDYWAIDPAMLPKEHPAYLPRLTEVKTHRADRIKAIGNGQVPMCIVAFDSIVAPDHTIHTKETI